MLTKKEKGSICGVMDVLIDSMGRILYSVCVLSHHVVHLKYLKILSSVKLKKKIIIPTSAVVMKIKDYMKCLKQ